MTPATVALIARLRELHTPADEYAEFDYDADDGPSPHCTPDCTPRACPGHTVEVQVCRECGYDHDDGAPIFRPWPCPTFNALTNAEAQARVDALTEKLTARYVEAEPT